MATLALHRQVVSHAARKYGIGNQQDLSLRKRAPDMKSDHAVHAADGVEIVQHFLVAEARLLRHLEHADHSARQLLLHLVQHLGRSQHHGDVGVVAAGVHHALVLIGKFQPRLFFHRKRVDVSAERDGLPFLSALDGGGYPAVGSQHLKGNPHALKLLLNFAGSVLFLQREFRVPVKPSSHLNDVSLIVVVQFLYIHVCASCQEICLIDNKLNV